MTPQQQADKINSYVAKLNDLVADSMELGIVNLEAIIRKRIFNNQLDIFGNKLGQYSNKSAYFTIGQFAKTSSFKAQGKGEHLTGQKRKTYSKVNSYTGEKTTQAYKSNLEDRKSMYLQSGYRELRAIQGKFIGAVDFKYTDDLFLNGIEVTTEGAYQIKFKNKLSTDKIRGYEERNKRKIAYASEHEKELTIDFVGKRIINGLKEVFGNV